MAAAVTEFASKKRVGLHGDGGIPELHRNQLGMIGAMQHTVGMLVPGSEHDHAAVSHGGLCLCMSCNRCSRRMVLQREKNNIRTAASRPAPAFCTLFTCTEGPTILGLTHWNCPVNT